MFVCSLASFVLNFWLRFFNCIHFILYASRLEQGDSAVASLLQGSFRNHEAAGGERRRFECAGEGMLLHTIYSIFSHVFFHSENAKFYLQRLRTFVTFLLSQDGYTPLHWAAYKGHAEVVDYLLSQGADATLVKKVTRVFVVYVSVIAYFLVLTCLEPHFVFRVSIITALPLCDKYS